MVRSSHQFVSSSFRIKDRSSKDATKGRSPRRATIGAVPAMLTCSLLLLGGCEYQEAILDANQVRGSAADFYNDEIMENLIRAYNRKIFVHVDLDTMQPNVSTKLAASFGGGQTFNNTATKQTTVGGSLASGVVGIMTTATQLAIRPFTFSLTPERDNTIQLNLSPQTGEYSVVYGLYLQFLALRSTTAKFDINNPKNISDYLRQLESSKVHSLQHGPQRPSMYVPGTLRRWNNEWYWICPGYAEKYFELGMLILDQPQSKDNADQIAKGVRELRKRPLPLNGS
jgi:hypothetical protein